MYCFVVLLSPLLFRSEVVVVPEGLSNNIIALLIFVVDSLQLREIKLDKVRAWKPFFKLGQQRVLAPRLLLDRRSRDQMMSFSHHNGLEMEKVGYEIYAEGPTRVLRICEIHNSFKMDTVLDWCAKVQLRVSQFAIHLLEHVKQVSLLLLGVLIYQHLLSVECS